MNTILDILIQGKKRFPQNPALKIKPKFRTLSWNYSQLYNFSCQIARLLEEKGIIKEDKVLLWAPNSPYWFGAFFGCLLKGIIPVPLHLENTPEFIEKVAEQTEAKLLLKYSGLKKPEKLKCPSLDIDYVNELVAREHKFVAPAIGEKDIAQILYTSGSTGSPKGVILTHKNIISNLKSIFNIIELKKEDKFLSILPLSHIFEQIVELRALSAGAEIVYAPALSSSVISRTIYENKVTKMAVVPEFLRRVLQRIEGEAKEHGKEKIFKVLLKITGKLPVLLRRILFRTVHKKFGGKLRLLVSGGAPLNREVAEKWRALGFNVIQGYGLTETSPVISVLREKDRNLESCGKTVPEVEVRISEDSEIQVRGPNVFPGYFKDPEKTRDAFEGDWFKTGDIGHLDKEGYLYIKGRKKFIILTESGQNVYPEDIETELAKEREVVDSCVIELKRGERTLIHAVLLSREKEKNLQEIIDEVNKRLASFQQIQGFSLWPFPDFPRTITRKPKREEISRFLQGKIAPQELKNKIKETSSLIKIISQITETEPALISRETNVVSDLKLDSLMRIELTACIEEEFGVEIDEAKITTETKVKDLEELIQKRTKKELKFKLRTWPRLPWVTFLRKVFQNFFFFPILLNLLTKIKVEGVDNLRGFKNPMIIMANHLSDLDTPVILKSLPSFIRKKTAVATAVDILYEKLWFVQPFIAFAFNTYPFPRKDQIKSGLTYTGELVDKGWSILLFPEGGISETGKLQVFKIGAGVLGAKMQVPVVPVKISGTNDVLPIHWKHPKRLRGEVIVKIGKPLSFNKWAAYQEVASIIEEKMREL